MERGEEGPPEVDDPAAVGRGPVSRDARETGVQVFWGVGKILIIMLAAFLGAMAVEAARSLF